MKKILLVEDEPSIARLVQFKLAKEGFDVTPKRNGREALEWLEDNKPDLILLDVMMPEMDGMEVLRQLKEDDSLKHIPVIMLSAKGQRSEIERCLTSGAADYIVKPFSPAEIIERVNALIK
ncbi:MAG TPA: response regulator transcription factor [Candidatus Hypogeohydataceae bacterium YC38]|nr:response regulator [Candidatus Brocadiales bacterium]